MLKNKIIQAIRSTLEAMAKPPGAVLSIIGIIALVYIYQNI